MPPCPRQYIFALTMDVDGFPGGALWRSDKHGAYDSWADQTQKVAAALPQVRALGQCSVPGCPVRSCAGCASMVGSP